MVGWSKKYLFFWALLFVIASTGCTEYFIAENEFNLKADELNSLKLEHNTLIEEINDAKITQDEITYAQKVEEYQNWVTENRPKLKEYEKYFSEFDSGSQEELNLASKNAEASSEHISIIQENLLQFAAEKKLLSDSDEFNSKVDELNSLLFEHDNLFEEINDAEIAQDDETYNQKVEEYQNWVTENRPKLKEYEKYFLDFDSDSQQLLDLARDNYAVCSKYIGIMQDNLLTFIPATTTAPPVTTEPPKWYDGLSTYEINSKATTITYENLIRKNEQYRDSIVSFKGKVLQVVGNYNEPYGVLIFTKMDNYGTYNDEIIYLVDYDLDLRLIEGDIITFRGVPDGFYSYETVGGGINTVPQLVPLQTLLE